MTAARRHRTPARRPRLDPARAAVAFVADEAVILDLADYSVVRANRTAALALRLMDGRRTVRRIGATVAATFRAPAPVVIAEVERWLVELARRGFVTRRRHAKGCP